MLELIYELYALRKERGKKGSELELVLSKEKTGFWWGQ